MNELEGYMTILVGISTLITALATIGICIFTWLNYCLYKEIKKNSEEQQQRFNDLFEGIIIATLLSGPSSYGAFNDCKKQFLNQYKGKSKIFTE